MHESVLRFVSAVVEENGLADKSTIELGSVNINGSCRAFFTGPYVGIDRDDGPGVDQVCDAEALPFPDEWFEVVLTTELAEHCDHPWVVLEEAFRVLKTGGWLIFTARGYSENGYMPVHNKPDRWRFSDGGLRVITEDAGFDRVEITEDWQAVGWLMVARKPAA